MLPVDTGSGASDFVTKTSAVESGFGVGVGVGVDIGVGVDGVGVAATQGTWGWKELNVPLQPDARFVTVTSTGVPKFTGVPVAVPIGQTGGAAAPRKSGAVTTRVVPVGEAEVTTAVRAPKVTDASAIVTGRLKPVIVTTVPLGPLVGTTDVMTGLVCVTR